MSSSDDDEGDDVVGAVPLFETNWKSGERLKDPIPKVLPDAVPKEHPYGTCPAHMCFMAFFPVTLITIICEWTNVAGKQRVTESNSRNNRKVKWQAVDCAEMYTFLSVCIAMSICPKGDERSYFKTKSEAGYVPSNLGRFMKYKRFCDIKMALMSTTRLPRKRRYGVRCDGLCPATRKYSLCRGLTTNLCV